MGTNNYNNKTPKKLIQVTNKKLYQQIGQIAAFGNTQKNVRSNHAG